MNCKVLSYCEIDEDIAEESYLADLGCDVYAQHRLPLLREGYQDCPLDAWIREEYPELEGETFLIHMDY